MDHLKPKRDRLSLVIAVDYKARRHIISTYLLITNHMIVLKVASQHAARHEALLTLYHRIIPCENLASRLNVNSFLALRDNIVLHSHSTRSLVYIYSCARARHRILLKVSPRKLPQGDCRSS